MWAATSKLRAAKSSGFVSFQVGQLRIWYQEDSRTKDIWFVRIASMKYLIDANVLFTF